MLDEVRKIHLPVAKKVIKSKAFDNFSMANKYLALQEKFDIDFSASIRLIEKMPSFLNGETHSKVRKEMAIHIAQTRIEQEYAVSKKIDELVSRYFKFECELDLVSDFARPIWMEFSKIIIKDEVCSLDVIYEIPELFDPTLSIRRRLAINSAIEHAIRDITEEELTIIALVALGARPFIGSMALSIYHSAQHCQGKPLHEYDWGTSYPNSALTYVDRICSGDNKIESENFCINERIRCITQAEEYTVEERADSLYGYGAHVCLGRQISQYTFDCLTDSLSRLSSSLTPVALTMESPCDPFYFPRSAIISVQIPT